MAHKQQIEINASHSTITGQIPTTNDDQEMEYAIIENCMVEVLPRTWPGSNKIGGIARVTKCHFLSKQSQTAAAADQNNSLNGGPTPAHIDVHYVVMGGREKMVPMEYCRPAPQYDHNIRRQQPGTGNANMNVGAYENGGQKNESEKGHIPKMARANLRDRSSLLGRCKLCGSLRNDCGSCDWIEEERKRREYQHQQQDQNQMAQGENDLISSKEFRRVENRRRQKKRQRRIKVSSLLMDDSESSDEEEDEDGNNDTFSEASQSYSNSSDESFSIRSRRNLIAARQRRVLSSSLDDDDESSTDDEILARLKALPMTQVKKKKLKTKFRANNRIFKARMDFLNECLNGSKKTVVRGDSKDAQRVGSNGTSVLESIGSSKNATDYGFSEMSRNESQKSMILRQNVDQYKDHNVDTKAGRGHSSKQSSKEKDPIPFFQSVGTTAESDAGNDIDFHQNQETHEYADTSKLRNVALETNANNTLDVDSEQNRPVSGIERRVGFVDGDDIGEKEIDEEEDEPMGEELDRGNITQNNHLSIQQRINRNEEISGYYEDSPARNTFIQPEGNDIAENLPSDLVDRSIHLPFASLPKFLDEIQVDLSELIPSFESASCRLENEFQAASNQVDKTLCKEQLLGVERRCRELFDGMCIALVRDGTDQYRCALKRFGKKREFRLGAHQLSKQQWREVVENLDLRFDGLDKLVEDSLRRVRKLLLDCSDKNGFNMNFEVDFTPASDEESYRSDGADFERDGGTRFSSSLPKSGRHAHARRSRNNDRMQSSRDRLGKVADSQLHRKKRRKKSDTSQSRRRSVKISKWQPSIGERGQFSHVPRSSYEGDDVISDKDHCESNARNYKEPSLEPNFGDKGINQGKRKNQKGRSTHSDPTVLSKSGGKISSSHLNIARGRKSGTNQSGFQRSRSGQSTSYQESVQSHNVEDLDNADDAGEDAEENDEMGVEISTDSVFAALSLSTNRPDISAGSSLTLIPSEAENPFSIQNVCENLSSAFPSQESNELLRELPLYFDSNILSGDSLHSSAVIVFSTLLDLLRKSGSHSLVEMITMKCQQVVVHIRLLCCVFGLMKRKVHLKLKDSDAIVYKVFSDKQFSTMVIFQIIDVLYALLLPEEWGSSVKMDSGIYKLLGDLRDELGGCMHVVEEFSHIILRFPIQKWRKSALPSINRNAWYVSSVDPTLLELLWQGDVYSGGKCDLRLGMFKKFWPRSEINALWGILAWFSNASSLETKTMIRWRLIVSQFTYATGSLGQLPLTNDVAAPPSYAQLQCCREEVRRFSLLLRSGALDPMPNDDGMFLKLLLKCITLNADDPSALSLPKMFIKTISKHDRKIAFKAWQESDVSYFVDTGVSNSDPLSRRLLLELSESDSQSSSLYSLVPNENVSAVLHLLKDWLHRIPNKRARWSRLGDAFKGLVRRLSADASVQKSSQRQSDQKSDEIVDDFAQCFSNAGPISPGIDATVGTRQSSLCHSIVLVIVTVLASRSKRSIEFDPNFPLRIDLQVCEIIWKTVASDRMQQHQSHLLGTTSILGESDQCEDSAHACMKCMQMFSTLILSYLDQITMGEISVDEHCLTFMLSCMLSSVVTTCERLSHSSKLVSFGQPFLPLSSLESAGDINTLSCGLLWLSCIVEKSNRILYENKSKNRSKVPKFQDALDHFIPRALRVSAKCFGTIPSCVGEEDTLGTCYRLALSLFRGTTHSFLIQNHFQSISVASINNIAVVDNDTSSDGNPVETNGNDDTEDLFGGIDDDALMAIDLDNINRTSDITEGTKRAQRIHDVCFKYVWKFLLDSLRSGKPSIRYAINQTSRHNKGSNTAQFTNTGKAVCATHSGGICALIASLCTVPELFAINESNLRLMIESLLPRNALSGFNTTTNSFSIDDEYLNDARQCLCSELCHVAKFGKNCMKIIDHMADAVILRTFLSAATNANVINAFPSFNKGVMIKIGGIQSKEKEDRSLSKALKKLESRSDNHPDAEGQSVQRHILDHCDTPGSIYMSSHFWRFCADLGIVLHSTAKYRPACERSFMLELGSSFLADSSFFASDSLKSLPRSSLERECLKRIILLKRILNTAFRKPAHFGTELSKIKFYTSTRTIVSSVISGLILQASCLIKGLDYYERNPSSSQPYTRAKTQALFTAYSDFMSSILSQLLLPQAIDIVSDHTEFVYRHVILPILSNQGLHINKTFFEASAGNPAGHRILHFEGGLPHTSTDQSVNSNTMLLTFCRYIGHVVQYARSDDGDHHFYDIMICIQSLDDKLLRNNVFLPTAFLEGAKLLTARGQLDLGDYIELHKGDTPQADAFNRFRSYAIRSFLLPRINHGTFTAEKKATLLLVLLQILDFKRIQRHYTCPHPFVISTGDDQLVDYLHLSHDVMEIFSSIFLCLDSIITHKTMNSSLILYCFACIRCMLTMNVENSNLKLIQWCTAYKEENETALQIWSYMEIFLSMSKILTSSQSTVLMEQYGRPKETIASPSATSDAVLQLNDMVSKIDSARNTSCSNQENANINLYLKPGVASMAVEVVSVTPYSLDKNLTKVLLAFQESFSKK